MILSKIFISIVDIHAKQKLLVDLQVNASYDVIIVCAGTAGCLAAYSAAKEGLGKIALVDRKTKGQIGSKICGDGIGIKHIEFLESLGYPLRENEVVRNVIQNAHIISPDSKTDFSIPIQGQLAIIDRHKFGQVLLNETINDQITLFDKSTLNSIEQKGNTVEAKFTTNKAEPLVLSAPLLIDGSGFNSKIREDFGIFDEYAKVKDDEQYYCYREICTLEGNVPEKYSDSAIFEFSYNITKGGYMWFFSRGGNEYNMGTGIPKTWIKNLSPKEIYQANMISRFQSSTVLNSGGGFVPTRHPIPTHVKDNIILTGDAGAIVNPLHGGGLGASLASGYIAGKIAAKVVPDQTVSEEGLWIYNQKILEKYCQRYSILDFYRILLQNIPDVELNHALAEGYLPMDKIFYAREYEQLMHLSRKLGQIWSQLPNQRFNLLPNYIEKVHQMTTKYPASPDGITNWQKEYSQIYSEFQSKIAIKK